MRLERHLQQLPLIALPQLALNVLVDRDRDGLVCAARFVLIDHRGPGGVMAHACHQVAQPGGALAANWLPVCRGSWKWRPGMPIASTALASGTKGAQAGADFR